MKDKKNIIITVLLTTIVILLVFIILLVTNKISINLLDDGDVGNIQNEDKVQLDENINLFSYVGVWQFFESSSNEIPERELIIKTVEDDKITFDLVMYRLAVFENVSAIIEDNSGTFEVLDDSNGWKISGVIKFNENSVVLDIDSSSTELIKMDDTVFSVKSNTSVLR